MNLLLGKAQGVLHLLTQHQYEILLLVMKRLLLATGNPNKAREIQQLLGTQAEVIASPVAIDVEEYGATCAANAVIKAKGYLEELSKLGELPEIDYVIADDSGIFVPFLGDNVPGVYSARFSLCEYKDKKLFPSKTEAPKEVDKMNNERLLQLLEDKDDEARKAYFYAAIAMLGRDGAFINLFEGLTFGSVDSEIVDIQGWGYDHIFIADSGNHWGIVAPEIKNTESHRYKSVSNLAAYLEHIS